MITASFQQQDTNDYALCGISLIINVQKRNTKSENFLPIFFATISAIKELYISFEKQGFQPISFEDASIKKLPCPLNEMILFVLFL